MKQVDITGQKFGRLTAIKYVGKDKYRRLLWLCKCDCGNEKVVAKSVLKCGATKSCGCLIGDINKARRLDITGNKYGRLTVLRYIGKNKKSNKHMWECRCDCGNIVIVPLAGLRGGHTKSCGCLQKDTIRDIAVSHDMSRTRFYSIYRGVVSRCNNKNNSKYHHYGGRGIKCLWSSFEEFYEDMYESYLDHVEEFGEDNTSIDRIDVDGDYCKENCRWATRKEQHNNMRTNHFIEVSGIEMTVSQAAEKYDINYQTAICRIHRGKDIFGNNLMQNGEVIGFEP